MSDTVIVPVMSGKHGKRRHRHFRRISVSLCVGCGVPRTSNKGQRCEACIKHWRWFMNRIKVALWARENKDRWVAKAKRWDRKQPTERKREMRRRYYEALRRKHRMMRKRPAVAACLHGLTGVCR